MALNLYALPGRILYAASNRKSSCPWFEQQRHLTFSCDRKSGGKWFKSHFSSSTTFGGWVPFFVILLAFLLIVKWRQYFQVFCPKKTVYKVGKKRQNVNILFFFFFGLLYLERKHSARKPQQSSRYVSLAGTESRVHTQPYHWQRGSESS